MLINFVLVLVTWFTLMCFGATALPPSNDNLDDDSHEWHRPHHTWHQHSPHGTPAASSKHVFDRIHAEYKRITLSRLPSQTDCTKEKLVVRREWGNMPAQDRQSFISAARCLAALPSRTAPELAPGARSRWDDFSVAHVLNTKLIHWSAWLLPWHRHFTWSMEQALRNECNYTAGMPYWEWPKYLDGPFEAHPLFDGSSTSLSGGGVSVAGNCTQVLSGPLSNWTVHLGPVVQDPSCNTNPQSDGLGFNPRPLERRFGADSYATLQDSNSYDNITEVILAHSDPADFNLRIDAVSLTNDFFGLHGPPHLAVGGLMSDTYASTGDPLFYLHHGMLDRVYSMWQSLDFRVRENDIGYTDGFDIPVRKAIFDWGPAPLIDLDSTLYLSPIFENITARKAMSPTGGKYCYIYE